MPAVVALPPAATVSERVRAGFGANVQSKGVFVVEFLAVVKPTLLTGRAKTLAC